MPDDLVLYGNDRFTSPYVFSAFVTLKEKACPVPARGAVARAEGARAPGVRRSRRSPGRCRPSGTGTSGSPSRRRSTSTSTRPSRRPLTRASTRRTRAARARVRMVQAFLRSDLVPLRHDASRPRASSTGEPVGAARAGGAGRRRRSSSASPSRCWPPGASVHRGPVHAGRRGPRAHAPAARRERRSLPGAARRLRARRSSRGRRCASGSRAPRGRSSWSARRQRSRFQYSTSATSGRTRPGSAPTRAYPSRS